ncbi:5-dehydro-2-deoxygluconokinase [Companilactobacillus jidongensis]|uniref:5-dehydro-2-deoxygluconokinase n=1 Tax=Companilactobacillus jidongensis TaxID=2486006 RepID=UPI000F794A80|nr:5-dehydro-2-deoxygluconokinase [Companilactobacillus jidongensis]
MTNLDLITLGRACIDLNAVEINRPMEETKTFSKYVGGSPINIAIGSSKLGLKVGFIGKIADDQHGRYIAKYINDIGIDTKGMIVDHEKHKTGLTFTEIKSPTESNILMYRDETADLYLDPSEIDEEYIKSAASLLISGTALAQSPSREATIKAARLAVKNNVKLIFELDYRPYTWKSMEEVSEYYLLIAKMADVVIGTRDEYDVMENIQNGTELDNQRTVTELFKYSPNLILIKHGKDGSFVYTRDGNTYEGGIFKTKVLKSFGAGDSYASGFIFALHNDLPIDTALKYGAAASSIVISKHSSSEAMPTEEEIQTVIADGEVKFDD